MDTHELHNELIEKKKQLEAVNAALKKQFIGIDHVADEVTSLMLPWYLFPEAQRRPTIINLWGLTGSGKTALVQKLIELLDYSKYYTQLDMGEFESDSASWIKSILTDDLDFFHEKPAIICMDEFQFARTLDANGNELGKDKLRVIWELLDSGKISYIPGGTFYLFRGENCLRRLDQALLQNVELQQGEIVGGLDVFRELFEGFYFFDQSNVEEKIDKSYFLSLDFIEGLSHLLHEDERASRDRLRKIIRDMSLEQLRMYIYKAMCKRPVTKYLDLSHALIFILGNLDEAYSMSQNMNPDISADEFHDETTKITIADVKRALRSRFRPEQIARLGNNHVIYRSFNREQFEELIERSLENISTFVRERFGWEVTYEKSVIDIIYAEGVFPSQGTRPVLTTVKNMIESRISKMVVAVLEENVPVTAVTWRYNDEHFIYALHSAKGEIIKTIADKASLKLENLRKSVDPEIQAHTAVHEAGHAVLAALTLRILPAIVVSRTASDCSEGFCLINFPKGPFTRETLKKDIIISLGGYVAEKMIFGEDLTSSGVYADLEIASEQANLAIRRYGMGSDPIHLALTELSNDHAFFDVDTYNHEAKALIKICEVEAETILRRNMMLLLKMAEYLTINSKMEEAEIGKFVEKYGVEPWIATEGFLTKENYFQFNTIVQEKLRSLEEKSADKMLRDLLRDEQVKLM